MEKIRKLKKNGSWNYLLLWEPKTPRFSVGTHTVSVGRLRTHNISFARHTLALLRADMMTD
jgi:hypothetical protein